MTAHVQSSVDAPNVRGVVIAEAARMLGVPMPTLRSWELRYGIPASSRRSGQHRRYSPAELNALRLMRDEIARGRRAGAAAKTVRELIELEGPIAELINRVLAGAQRLDRKGIRLVLDDAAATLGLATCIDDVMLPALRQVGDWWAIGQCDAAPERVATDAVRSWLDEGAARAPASAIPRPILLACGPVDSHTVGLESLALLLRHAGWPCRLLGTRTPTAALTAAVKERNAAAVVVVSHLATGKRGAVASIEAVADMGVKVFRAGNAFIADSPRHRIPGVYLGTRMGDACALMVQALAPDARPALNPAHRRVRPARPVYG